MSKGPEAIIENYLVKQCKKVGGVAEKFTSPQKRSVPDRLCQFEYNLIYFVELKAEGKLPTAAQSLDHHNRRARGHVVYVIDSKKAVDAFIAHVKLKISILKGCDNAYDLI